MVREIDLSWNTLELILSLMYQKLTDLGLTYHENKIVITEGRSK